MKKVYVEQVPNCCAECEWCHFDGHGGWRCSIAGMPICWGDEKIKNGCGRHEGGLNDFDCPLAPVSEIKKVMVEKIKKFDLCLDCTTAYDEFYANLDALVNEVAK